MMVMMSALMVLLFLLIIVVVMMLMLIVVIIVIVMMVLMLIIVIIVVVMMVLMLIVVIIVIVMMLVLIVIIIFLLDCFNPSGGLHRFLKIKTSCIQDIGDSDLGIVSLDDDSIGLQASDNRLELTQLILIDRVHLIHENCVAELKLLNKKILDILFLIRILEKAATVFELIMHTGTVNHRNNIVENHRHTVFGALLADVRDCLSDRNRFTDTGSFNNNVVILSGRSELAKLCCQIVSECTADTTVRKRNKVAVFLCNNAALFNEIRIYVYFTDIIYDNSCANSFIVTENVI